MTQQQSFSHIDAIINGHRFTGWANESPPYSFEQEESSVRSVGPDGGLYALGMAAFGNSWTFKLQPNSPTAQWCVQQEQMRKDAHAEGEPLRTYSGTLVDNALGTDVRLEGGVIVKLPAVIVPGETYEGMIQFENVASNVDGGNFRAPRATP